MQRAAQRRRASGGNDAGARAPRCRRSTRHRAPSWRSPCACRCRCRHRRRRCPTGPTEGCSHARSASAESRARAVSADAHVTRRVAARARESARARWREDGVRRLGVAAAKADSVLPSCRSAEIAADVFLGKQPLRVHTRFLPNRCGCATSYLPSSCSPELWARARAAGSA